MNNEQHIIDELYQVITSRMSASADNSYTALLLHKGIDSILKKVGEEATEVVIAGKGGSDAEVVSETADLIYHLLVLLVSRKIAVESVWNELRRRSGTSGIQEKASRKKD